MYLMDWNEEMTHWCNKRSLKRLPDQILLRRVYRWWKRYPALNCCSGPLLKNQQAHEIVMQFGRTIARACVGNLKTHKMMWTAYKNKAVLHEDLTTEPRNLMLICTSKVIRIVMNLITLKKQLKHMSYILAKLTMWCIGPKLRFMCLFNM